MWRILVECPVVGGEKFAAVIGPSRRARNATRALLALAFLAFGAAGLAPLVGRPATFFAIPGVASLALSLACAWITGGEESLVCQGEVLRHRMAGVFGDRRLSAPVVDLVRCRAIPATRLAILVAGIRLVTVRGEWRIGRGLRPDEAGRLANLLERHLAGGLSVRPTPAPGAGLRTLPRRGAAAPALSRHEDRLQPRFKPPDSCEDRAWPDPP